MEHKFIRNKEQRKPWKEKQEEERSKADHLRGTPASVGTLEETIDDNHAILSTSVGSEHHISILLFVEKDLLEPGSSVLLNHKVYTVMGCWWVTWIPWRWKSPQRKTYANIRRLDNQIQKIKEPVELPLSHIEYYEEMTP